MKNKTRPAESAARAAGAINSDGTIHLGYEVGTGEPVSVPLRHMAVTGQTQESGKTTTLEALITRSGLRAVAFITKRGEGAFQNGRQVQPYFEERTDWQFIESILESTMKQSMSFKQPWIVRVCDGTHTLAEVQARALSLMETSRPGMNQDMYLLLNEYLKIVVPLIRRLPKSSSVSLRPGLNVMNLAEYPEELQQLVIASTLRWIHQHERDVVIVVPEAWQFVPQGKKTPVQAEVKKIARLGAGLKNYLWLDSQDMAGVEKEVLRACAVWLIGVQREINEVNRALKNMQAGMKKPKPEEVAHLGVGEFYACWHTNNHKVYVQPAWLDEETARHVARGTVPAANVQMRKPKPPAAKRGTFANPYDDEEDEMSKEIGELAAAVISSLTPALNNLADAVRGAHSNGAPGLSDQEVRLAIEERITARLKEFRALAEKTGGGGAAVDYDEVARLVLERLPSGGAVGVDIDHIVDRVIARIPAGGVVKVEPKEVVLKQFQRAEAERILEKISGLSAWQKQVLCLVEAKGSRLLKADMLRMILGKTSSQVKDYQQKYAEIEELAGLGFLRKDKEGRFYPNLEESMKERLSAYSASDREIEEVVGQVLLRVQKS